MSKKEDINKQMPPPNDSSFRDIMKKDFSRCVSRIYDDKCLMKKSWKCIGCNDVINIDENVMSNLDNILKKHMHISAVRDYKKKELYFYFVISCGKDICNQNTSTTCEKCNGFNNSNLKIRYLISKYKFVSSLCICLTPLLETFSGDIVCKYKFKSCTGDKLTCNCKHVVCNIGFGKPHDKRTCDCSSNVLKVISCDDYNDQKNMNIMMYTVKN